MNDNYLQKEGYSMGNKTVEYHTKQQYQEYHTQILICNCLQQKEIKQ